MTVAVRVHPCCAYREASDIAWHLPKLYELACQCQHVTEMGTRRGNSTTALLAVQPQWLIAYDVARYSEIDRLTEIAGRTEFVSCQQNTLAVDIEPTDLLFIDTYHTYHQLQAELERHAARVRRWLVLHDTATYGEIGEDGDRGLLAAVDEFLSSGQWRVAYSVSFNNGLTVLERSQAG